MELTGTILDVTGRKVNTKFGESDVYDVQFSDGNTYGTFKEALAAEASKAKGLNNVTIKLEQNGDFWNFAGIASLGTGSEPEVTLPVSTNGPTPGPTKEQRIHRQTAFKVAATFLSGGGGSKEELFTLAQEIEDHFNEVGTKEWA